MSDYGSGTLGPLGARTVSTDTQFEGTRTGGVWAFGDSILRADGPDLAQRLYDTTGMLLAVDSQSSRPTAGCVDALADRVGAHGPPSTVLMAAGTNDIFDPPAMAAQVERVRSLCPAAVVVWPTVYVRRWSQALGVQIFDTQNSGWVNAYLHEAAGLRLVGWFEYLCRPNSSGNLNRPGQCLSDGVHTTETGRIARNTLIVQATRP